MRLFFKTLVSAALLFYATAFNTASAQTCELHISALGTSAFRMDNVLNHTELSISYGDVEKTLIEPSNTWVSMAIKDLPIGKVKIDVTANNARLGDCFLPYSDSLELHPGVNVLLLELKRENTVTSISEVDNGKPGASSQLVNPPVVAPKTVPLGNGVRRLESMALHFHQARLNSNIPDHALRALLKMEGVKADENGYLIISNPNIHWSWKNGALLIWEDQ